MKRVSSGDEFFMRRTFELARLGAGFVSPNPMAGCVIVKDGAIVAEGYHKKFGGAHAEISAIKQAKSRQLTADSMYINLEPCVHTDKKTPPCVPEIIRAGVTRVVVGMKDPNPAVAGRGIRALRRAGIRVDVGVLEKESRELNETYAKWIVTGRPFVLLKVAVTLDGALTLKKGTRSGFSSPESYAYVHELRQLYDAIALGSESILIDNPLLTARRKGQRSRNPVRVIFDRRGRVQKSAKVFHEPGETLVFSSSLAAALRELGRRGVMSVLVEGGAKLAQSFLRGRLVDKLMVTVTPQVAHDLNAPRFPFGYIRFSKSRWEIRGADAWFIGYLGMEKKSRAERDKSWRGVH